MKRKRYYQTFFGPPGKLKAAKLTILFLLLYIANTAVYACNFTFDFINWRTSAVKVTVHKDAKCMRDAQDRTFVIPGKTGNAAGTHTDKPNFGLEVFKGCPLYQSDSMISYSFQDETTKASLGSIDIATELGAAFCGYAYTIMTPKNCNACSVSPTGKSTSTGIITLSQ